VFGGGEHRGLFHRGSGRPCEASARGAGGVALRPGRTRELLVPTSRCPSTAVPAYNAPNLRSFSARVPSRNFRQRYPSRHPTAIRRRQAPSSRANSGLPGGVTAHSLGRRVAHQSNPARAMARGGRRGGWFRQPRAKSRNPGQVEGARTVRAGESQLARPRSRWNPTRGHLTLCDYPATALTTSLDHIPRRPAALDRPTPPRRAMNAGGTR
jgi:hypothetical protein